MIRLVISGDWHLEAGVALGVNDAELGTSRMRDARIILRALTKEEADAFIFLGDLARTARPGPVAYNVAAEALKAAEAAPDGLLMLTGNHDWPGTATYSCLDVLARSLPRAAVARKPGLRELAGVQVGVLPWVPPSMLFDAAPHSPKRMGRLVAEKLLDIARGMGAKLDAEKPSLLVGHWALLGIMPEIAEHSAEPILRPEDLEASGPWDAVVMGHLHVPGRVGERCYSCGPPMRGGFGEQNIETGYLICEWDEDGAFTVKRQPTKDRQLVTIEVNSAENPPIPKGSIVRIRGTLTEPEAQLFAQNNEAQALIDACMGAGAFKVVGPQIKVERERRRRSNLTAEVDPMAALDAFMEANEVEPELRPLVAEKAKEVMASDDR